MDAKTIKAQIWDTGMLATGGGGGGGGFLVETLLLAALFRKCSFKVPIAS